MLEKQSIESLEMPNFSYLDRIYNTLLPRWSVDLVGTVKGGILFLNQTSDM